MITKVEIVDFLSHRDTTLELDSGMNVIVGPNGAGKSSVVDAIIFALFGEYTRGTKDSLSRRGTTGGYVRVEFGVGERHFDVTRKIGGGSSATLREKKDGNWSVIAAGERRQMGESTKREVEKILGMDFKTLQIASIIRQGELGGIVHEDPKAFKTRINSIINIDVLDRAHEKMHGLIGMFRDKIREEHKHDDKHIATLTLSISEARKSLQETRAQAASLAESKREFEIRVSELDKQFNEVKDTKNAREQWDKRRVELERYVRTLRNDTSSEIKRLDSVIAECKDALGDRDKGAGVKDQIESLVQARESAESEITVCEKTLSSLNEKLSMSKKLTLQDGKCPVCNSSVSELNPLFVAEHISAKIGKVRVRLEEQRVVAAESKQEALCMKKIESDVTAATATLRAHSVNSTQDIERMKQKIVELEGVCGKIDSCLDGNWRVACDIDQQTQVYCDELGTLELAKGPKDAPSIDDVRDKLKAARHKLDETIAELGAATDRAESLEKKITDYEKLRGELERAGLYVKRLEAIQGVFHRDGSVATSFRSWALTTVSDACTEYLAALDTRIRRITLSEKKRSVEIACHAGSDSFGIDSLSGGEQICVALALRLGMARLLGISRPAFVILDEPTAHLDEYRRKSMVHVLAGLSGITEAGAMQFVVITHDVDIFDEAPVERRYELEAGPDGTRLKV